MIRIGFTLIGGERWTGGRVYLLNLLRAIAIYERNRLSPLVFVGTDVDSRELAVFRDIAGVELIASGTWSERRRRAELAKALVLGRDAAAYRELRDRGVDVFFESARYFGWRPGIPIIAWVPDLQHRALRQMFSTAGWWKRELGIQAQVASGRIIMLSSESACHDLERQYPAAVGRTRVVRFAVPAGFEIDDEEARVVVASYGLPQNYFFLPNQFWRHKNHLLVLDALISLRKRGREFVVVATGRAHDPRAPGYFEEFSRRLQAERLGDQFRYLGVIPYEHLGPILAGSLALLNPSLFEGWSTTVEEARTLGVPTLLSDLPVHREQMGDAATYFDPRDPESLASALESFVPISASERRERAVAARQEGERRYRAFASRFADLCEEVVARSAAPPSLASGRRQSP
jgi:glycosyltransferase involved in cell wall biosynthesis